MKALKFTAIIEGDKDGYYAYCPELKGCQSQGDSVEEALANLREAAELFMETLAGMKPSPPLRPGQEAGRGMGKGAGPGSRPTHGPGWHWPRGVWGRGE